MKKIILPLLLGIFTLFFSGKPASIKNCGPYFTIDNLCCFGPDDVPVIVTQVFILNNSTGMGTTYNNPTFPLTYNGPGGNFTVTFIFNNLYHAGLYAQGEGYCNVENVHNNSSIAISFPAFNCASYNITLMSLDPTPNANWICD